jgi:hypothetical protein
MHLEPTKHVNGCMWPLGQSGNPNGRPVGSRTIFSQAFCRDLAEVWSEEGREAMLKTAKTNPTVFFATCARPHWPRGEADDSAGPARQFEPRGLGNYAGDYRSRSSSSPGCCFASPRRDIAVLPGRYSPQSAGRRRYLNREFSVTFGAARLGVGSRDQDQDRGLVAR